MADTQAPTKIRRGTEKRLRNHSVLIRLDDAERAALEEAASQAGLTLASYGRQMILGGKPPRSVRRPPIEREILAKLLGQLGKLGSNLNQIARAANTTGADPAEVRLSASVVQEAARAVMIALGRRP